MTRYTLIKELGEGSFGSVWAALDWRTFETVAVKQLKGRVNCSWQECLNEPEIKSLSVLKHPNIVKLRDWFTQYDGSLYFVLEYMECNLLQLMQTRRLQNNKFSESEVRNFCYQIFHGLAYMHKNGYMHRDLKPENLLAKNGEIKIGDFGSAAKIDSRKPFREYVTTRWYRAPELLLGSLVHDAKVDTWAMGAIMAELFNLRPLFPGVNAIDQMLKICSVIGSPSWVSWPEGHLLALQNNYKFPTFDSCLSSVIPLASASAIELISSLCSWNPQRRPTAAEALQHSFFVGSYRIPRAIARWPAQYHIAGIREEGSTNIGLHAALAV